MLKLLLLAAALLLPSTAAAQAMTTPTQAATTAVLAPIHALFAAFEASDAAAMLRQVYPDGRVTASGLRGDGASSLRRQSWAASRTSAALVMRWLEVFT